MSAICNKSKERKKNVICDTTENYNATKKQRRQFKVFGKD